MQHRVFRLINIAILVVIVFAGFGQAVLQLWNHLMPDIFGLHPISYWQAVGLMGLSWILFGGLRGALMLGGPRLGPMRHMNPEQREKFRAAMEKKCGVRTTEA